MRHLKSTFLAASLLAISACAQAGPANSLERAEVESIIQEYLLENPEIIREALLELDKRADREAITSLSDALFNDPRDVSIGPKDAKVTIVEFFDYNCGYCKLTSGWIKEAMEKHPKDVRVVFKELPVLENRTKTSRNAARAALAAARQGKYADLHFALMDERGLSEERVLEIAEKQGLDITKLKADMKEKSIEDMIDNAFDVAKQIPSLTGTPFFVINDDFVPGGNVDKLEEMLKAKLEES